MSKLASLLGASLVPCPFCGCAEVEFTDGDIVWFTCGKCGAEGPSAQTSKTALKRWNTRAEARP